MKAKRKPVAAQSCLSHRATQSRQVLPSPMLPCTYNATDPQEPLGLWNLLSGSFSSVLPPVPRPSLSNSHLIFKNQFTHHLLQDPALPPRLRSVSLACVSEGRRKHCTHLQSCRQISWGSRGSGTWPGAATRQRKASSRCSPPAPAGRSPQRPASRETRAPLQERRAEVSKTRARRGPAQRTWDTRSAGSLAVSLRSPQLFHKEGPHTVMERASSAANR